MLQYVIGVILTLGLIAAVYVGFEWYRSYRFRPIEEGLSGFSSTSGLQEELQGTWRGRECRIHYGMGGRYERDWIDVEVESTEHDLPRVSFRDERWYHVLSKLVGLSREPQVGLPSLDRSLYMVDGERDVVRSWLERPDVRANVERLMAPSRTELHVFPDRIRFRTYSSWGWGTFFQPERMRDLLDELCDLATCEAPDGSPNRSTQERQAPGNARFSQSMQGLLLSGLATVLAGPPALFIGLYFPPVRSNLYFLALKIAGVLLAGYLIVAFLHARGHSRAHREFSTYAITGAVGIPSLIMGGMLLVNALLAPGETERVRAVIKRIRHTDDEYEVEVLPQTDRFKHSIALDYSGDPNRLNQKRPALVVISNGALGYPWLKTYRLPAREK